MKSFKWPWHSYFKGLLVPELGQLRGLVYFRFHASVECIVTRNVQNKLIKLQYSDYEEVFSP